MWDVNAMGGGIRDLPGKRESARWEVQNEVWISSVRLVGEGQACASLGRQSTATPALCFCLLKILVLKLVRHQNIN